MTESPPPDRDDAAWLPLCKKLANGPRNANSTGTLLVTPLCTSCQLLSSTFPEPYNRNMLLIPHGYAPWYTIVTTIIAELVIRDTVPRFKGQHIVACCLSLDMLMQFILTPMA